jgi:hypothetical protein
VTQIPVEMLLAFANDWVDDRRHLRSLLDESNAIGRAIAPLIEAGALALAPPVHNATIDAVIEAFRRHYKRICIFHFGGHAGDSALMLEDAEGRPTPAHAGGLAGYLGQQPGLVLVFLNGCSTEPQVRRLRAAGVKAVVATTREIDDRIAAEFATAFYAELVRRPLRSAFDTAVEAVRARRGDDPRAVTRDIRPRAERGRPVWPWIIDCDPRYADWKPGPGVPASEGRLRRAAPVLAAGAAIALQEPVLRGVTGLVKPRREKAREPGGHDDEGMTVAEIGKLLELNGIAVHIYEHASVRDVATELELGHEVILCEDLRHPWSANTWLRQLHQRLGLSDAEPALIVCNTDARQAQSNTVTMCNPITGRMETIPLQHLVSACQNCPFSMLATNDPPPLQMQLHEMRSFDPAGDRSQVDGALHDPIASMVPGDPAAHGHGSYGDLPAGHGAVPGRLPPLLAWHDAGDNPHDLYREGPSMHALDPDESLHGHGDSHHAHASHHDDDEIA